MSGAKSGDTSARRSELKKEKEKRASKQTEKHSPNKSSSAKETGETESQGVSSAAGEESPSGDAQQEAVIDYQEVITQLETENAGLSDQLLRKQADFENFRKRVAREKEEMARYANSMLLLDVIEIIDDFERAMKSSEESRDFEAFHSGIELIEKRFTSMLERKWGLNRFDSEGEVFDPERHQAIATEESDKHEQPTVVEDYQKGYLLYDRVLRPAKVKVVQPTTEIKLDERQANNTEAIGGDNDGKNNRN